VKIGVPTEIKAQENRVALTPAGAERLTHAGHHVLVQSGAGVGSGFTDETYQRVGAKILGSAAAVFGEADLILKVKEPLESEWPLLRKGQTLFTYLHLAASRPLTEALVKTGAYCFAYETLEVGRELPLLTPMSEVAGRMAIQAGAKYLEKAHGGSGILLGGVPGVKPAKVVVIGGGVVGINSARMAAGLGADVTVLDTNLPRLRYLDEVLPKNCHTVYSTRTCRAQARAARGPEAHEPRLGDRRRGRRPGRLRRDLQADHARGPGLHGRRRAALLRGEHARRRAAHQHLCVE
jgi:alanine dehydrogenase